MTAAAPQPDRSIRSRAGRPPAVRPRSARARDAAARAELDDLAELAARRRRSHGFEGFGFVVGADGSATGGSLSGALAAVGVVSGQLAAAPPALGADRAGRVAGSRPASGTPAPAQG